jgi:hypothetical protein
MAIRLPPNLLSHASASGGLVKSGRSTEALVTRASVAPELQHRTPPMSQSRAAHIGISAVVPPSGS